MHESLSININFFYAKIKTNMSQQLNRTNGIFGDMPEIYSAFFNDNPFMKTNRVHELVFTDPTNTTPLTTLKASPLATNYTLTLPPSIGLDGQTLAVNGIGELEWKSVGGSFTLPTASDSVLGGLKIQASSGLAMSGDDLEFSFNKSMIPTATTFDIGSSVNRVNKLYANEIDASTSVQIGNCIIAGNSGTNYTYSLPAALPTSQKVLGVDATGQVSYQPSYDFSFPSSIGTSGQVLKTNGDGTTEWVSSSAGGIVAATSSTLGGVIVPSGKNLSLDASGNIGFEFSQSIVPTTALLAIGSGAVPLGVLHTIQVNASQFVMINNSFIYGSSSLTSFTLPDYNFSFPPSVGTSGQVLQTDGDGKSSWLTISGGGTLAAATDSVLGGVKVAAASGLKMNGDFIELDGNITGSYALGAGTTGWSVDGPGLNGTQDNPTITLFRGLTYEFNVSISGHPPSLLKDGGMFSDTVVTEGVTATTDKLVWSVPFTSIPNETFFLRSTNDATKTITIKIGRELTDTPGVQSVTSTVGSGLKLIDNNGRTVANFSKDWNKSYIYFHENKPNGSVLFSANPNVTPTTGVDVLFYLPTSNGSNGQVLQTDGAGATSWVTPSSGSSASTLSQYTADALGNSLDFEKSRNATVGTQTIVQDGDTLGNVSFFGSDGTVFVEGAAISGVVDGTPASGGMPGAIVLKTSPAGAANAVERFRVNSTYMTSEVPIRVPSFNSSSEYMEVTGTAFTKYSLALGKASEAKATYSVAIGYGANANANYGGSGAMFPVAVGSQATASAVGTTAVGGGNNSTWTKCVASGSYSSAFGSGAKAESDYSVAIGASAKVQTIDYGTAVGHGAECRGGGVCLGKSAGTSDAATNTIVISGDGGFYKEKASALFVSPITPSAPAAKAAEQNGTLVWDATTKEVFVSATPVIACYELTAPSSSVYRVVGPGLPTNADNPTIRVYCGFTYRFAKTSSSHPIELRATSGGAEIDTDYTTITGSGVSSVINYTIPHARAGSSVILQCTSHAAMIVTLSII